MKRHVSNTGGRKWFSDHMTELQSESLKAVDQFAGAFGQCALFGCEIYDVDTGANTYKISDGLVVLKCDDGVMRVMPFIDSGAIANYNQVQTIVVQKTAIAGQYENPSDTTIAYNYEAVVVQGDQTGSGESQDDGEGILIPANATSVKSYYDLLNQMFADVYEPKFTKNSAFNKNFGSSAGQVAEGNHLHTGVYEPVFSKNSAFNKNFGSATGTVSEGDHNHDDDYVQGSGLPWSSSESGNFLLISPAGTVYPSTPNSAFNRDFGQGVNQVEAGSNNPSGLKRIVVEIGAWDFTANVSKEISYPQGVDASKVINASGYVRNDPNTGRYPFNSDYGSILLFNSSIHVIRNSVLDTSEYNQTSINRGWIILDMLP